MSEAGKNLISSSEFSDDFLEYTKKVWESVLCKEITTEEAREIAENIVGLELYLRELKNKYG